jgi:two-component sensor histidine kinase
VRTQLAHFEGFIGKRIAIEGPALPITAEAAQPLSMALHELATNAGKYGALSNNAGEVKIAWGIEDLGGGARFHLSWTESGGPPVAAPHACGFGTKVITQVPQSQLDAEVTYEFPPTGVEWRLVCPARQVLEQGWEGSEGGIPA